MARSRMKTRFHSRPLALWTVASSTPGRFSSKRFSMRPIRARTVLTPALAATTWMHSTLSSTPAARSSLPLARWRSISLVLYSSSLPRRRATLSPARWALIRLMRPFPIDRPSIFAGTPAAISLKATVSRGATFRQRITESPSPEAATVAASQLRRRSTRPSGAVGLLSMWETNRWASSTTSRGQR